VTLAISGMAISVSSAAARTRPSASSPTRNCRFRLIRAMAITASKRPIRIDPTASGVTEPVTWCAARPIAAMTRPINAAESSANTALRVGSDVAMTCSIRSRSSACATGFAWWIDLAREMPSSTKEIARTT